MPFELRHMQPGDAEWLVEQHRQLYMRDEGFDESFAPLVADILADFEQSHDPECERAFIACSDDQRLGSVFCVRLDEKTAKLRLFLLVPEARGQGAGRMMLDAWMRFARQAGYDRAQLWTHESHKAACALYQAMGWRITRSEPVHSFGVSLVEQTWEIDL
ncbi:GNAT family N-acetyltransferase [Thalassococcus lentus]|uniref:GNAT family N-acetyltransferase n=1 Tax=Thalassococcus lentus TaxID=1210524 RepID=A0ABT4XUB2_9RHOB|nr:GNAT family N-acetyltransferase [Thalassococcus lentus]MDA7425398.1 GNAT family N-acetyltransferase [Thalassococcus lentus]